MSEEKDFIIPGVSGVITFLKDRTNRLSKTDVISELKNVGNNFKIVEKRIEGNSLKEITEGMDNVEISTAQKTMSENLEDVHKGGFYNDLVGR